MVRHLPLAPFIYYQFTTATHNLTTTSTYPYWSSYNSSSPREQASEVVGVAAALRVAPPILILQLEAPLRLLVGC